METKVKILFFIETLKEGGAEKVLCNLVNNMDQRKFEITVQTVWPCDASKYLVHGIRYKSMYASASKANQLRYRVEAESGMAYRLHIKGNYDIECAYLEMGPTKVMAASTNKKAKKLAWVHCDLKKKMGDTEAFVKKTADWYRTYDKVICVSQNVRESFVQLFGDNPESIVLYNTIDDVEILQKAKAALQLPEKRRTTLIAVGRLAPEKGLDRLIRTSSRLCAEGFFHDLWIVGDGPERQNLEALVSQEHAENSAKLLGYQENPYPFMRAADVYVCSSHYEGMSTTVIESLLLGLPIITTDCGGMQELLGDSEYGLIVENNEDSLYKGIKRILENDKLRNNYARKAVERGAVFSASALSEQAEKYFETIVNR